MTLRPEFNEPLVAADERGRPTLAWYTTLLRHALHSTKPRQVCVLWGPPGVGKTLAAERIEAMFVRRAAPTGLVGRRDATYGYYSCASIDDTGALLDAIQAFASTASVDAVLVVDDVDAIAEDRGALARLFALLAERARCRRIVIVNNLYELAYAALRRPPLKQHFFDLYVPHAHIDTLTAYLQRKIETLREEPEAARGIAEQSGGDVRAALISASLDCALLRAGAKLQTGVGVAHDTRRRDEPLVHTLARLARDACVDDLYARADHESATDCLYANYPRFLTAWPARPRLDEAAEIADSLSDADRNESACRRGEGPERRLAFEMTLGTPLRRLGAALRGTRTGYEIHPRMEFMRRRATDTLTLDQYDRAVALLGAVRGSRLVEALQARAGGGSAWDDAQALVARCAASGIETAMLARAYLRHLALTETQSTLTEDAIVRVLSRSVKRPASEVGAPAPKRGRQQSLGAMMGLVKK